MVNQVYVSAVVGNLISFTAGTSLSWSSPVLPKLNVTDVDKIPFGRRITSDENSWIGGLLSLGAIFGPFIFGYLADKIGRKFTLLSIGIPFLAAYIILAFSKVVALYYVSRLMVGVAVGGVFTVVPMYIGEIAEKTNRGALMMVLNVLLTFGLLFSYCIGAYTPLIVYNIILAIVPLVFMVVFFFVATESPYYHVVKGNQDAAVQCLDKLRDSDTITEELDAIKASIEQAGKGTFLDLFKSKGRIKALIISLSLVAFQQMSGINAVLFYAQTIFDVSGGDIPSEVSSIIIGAVLFITSFVTPLFIDRLGRKILLYFSAIGMLLSEVPLGVYFYLQQDGTDVDAISWLPVVSMVVYIITYNCGFGPLPWAVMGELFPANVKSVASSLTAAFCWFISFIITKCFQSLVDGIGMGPCFWLFASFCAASFFFVLFYVIETKGKSLQEIQEILES